MAWRHTLTLRTASTGAALSGQSVALYEGDGSGDLVGDYTDNGDGTYYLVMTALFSQVGTIKVNGVIQTEKISIGILGEDVVDHLIEESYGVAGAAASVHGVESGEGEIVGTLKTQTLTNKTFASGSGTSIDASLVDAGTFGVARIPTLTEAKIPQLTAAGNGVLGEAVGLNTSGAIEDNTGLQIKVNPTTPTLEIAAAGIQVALKSSLPGLKRNATGLSFDESTMMQIVTANKVHPSSIAVNWQNHNSFDSDDLIDTAIEKLDQTLWRTRVDLATADTRAVCLYNQNHEDARNSSGTGTGAVTDATKYFLADTTERRKLAISWMKNSLMDRILVRGEFNVDTAGVDTNTITINIKDTAGSTQLTYSEVATGDTWTVLNAVADVSNLAAGLYWVEVLMEASANVAQLRQFQLYYTNTTWITLENDPAQWADVNNFG